MLDGNRSNCTTTRHTELITFKLRHAMPTLPLLGIHLGFHPRKRLSVSPHLNSVSDADRTTTLAVRKSVN